MWWEFLIIALLVLLNGFFAMSEMALVSSRPAELRRRAELGSRGARQALDLLEDQSRLLSAVQIGITLVGIVAGAYSGATLGGELAHWLAVRVPTLAEWSSEIAMSVVIGLITYLSLVFGELVPKRLALRHAETIAIRVAPIMRWVAVGGAPLVHMLRHSTDSILRLLGQRPDESASVTEEEVRAVIAEGALNGAIDPIEKEMIDRVMLLSDRAVGSIMTPRPDIVWLNADGSVEDWRKSIQGCPQSRFPVARGSLDEVIGYVDTRKLLDRLLTGEPFAPAELIEPAAAVHEGTRAPRLIEMFRKSGVPFALVLDEHGHFEGVVTNSDILAAIAGELTPAGPDADEAAVRRADGSWLVDGLVPVHEVEALTGIAGMADESDFHTLAGFVLSQVSHLPKVGDRFTWHGWHFEVVDMDGRRIDRILIEPPRGEGETSGSGI
jgi:putative hemolysin